MDKRAIYGIEFDESVPDGGEKRLFDAAGLDNDYVVGNTFQKHGGKNDFDEAFPFGAMRLCCVRQEGERRQVIYGDQPGFARDGSAGNVMVEIPKFYSRREKEGSVERWCVSGTCHPGFSLEPAFVRSGEELDFVYVAVYNVACREGGLFSWSGEVPDIGPTAAEMRASIREGGYDPYDLAVHLMLQRLLLIEMGTRRLKQILGGLNFLCYFNGRTTKLRIQKQEKNTVYLEGTLRQRYMAPGHELGLGHTEHVMPLYRTITSVSEDPEGGIKVCYGGEDLSRVLQTGVDSAFGMPQLNGFTDCLSYHTGRTDLVAPLAPAEHQPLVNGFRYRWIENVWGNMWENLEGLWVKNLQYYYATDPEDYQLPLSQWKTAPFPAPEQNRLAMNNDALWLERLGLIPGEELIPLPEKLQEHGVPFTHYESVFYAYGERDYDDKPVPADRKYGVVVGSGFDHSVYGALFTYRCFVGPKVSGWLYSDRACLRRK